MVLSPFLSFHLLTPFSILKLVSKLLAIMSLFEVSLLSNLFIFPLNSLVLPFPHQKVAILYSNKATLKAFMGQSIMNITKQASNHLNLDPLLNTKNFLRSRRSLYNPIQPNIAMSIMLKETKLSFLIGIVRKSSAIRLLPISILKPLSKNKSLIMDQLMKTPSKELPFMNSSSKPVDITPNLSLF